MKKLLLSILTILGVMTMFAQTIVSTTPENRNVVLEEFTGIHCVYCPDGHKVANDFADANPGDVLLINIHTGGYAVPSGDEPDFRTPWGDDIAGQTDLAGYPAGTINRHIFTGMQQASGSAMSRGDWATAGALVLAEQSYVNIAATCEVDVVARTMTVFVEAYYTGDSPETSNWLNIAILQNNIEGPQTGGSDFYPEMVLPNGNYLHHHMLRELITGQWGEEITTTTTGSLFSNTYVYNLPDEYNGVGVNFGNLELGVFITETHQEVQSGILVEPTVITVNDDARIYGLSIPQVGCGVDNVAPVVRIQNLGTNALTSLSIELDVNGGAPVTFEWSGNLASFEEDVASFDPYTFVIEEVNTVTISTVSTNGGTDGNSIDNSASTTFDKTPATVNRIHFVLQTDDYGTETTWEFVDASGNIIIDGGPYADTEAIVEDIDIELGLIGCYQFNIYDTYGDGIDAGWGYGFFTITDMDGNEIIAGGQFGEEDNKPFEVTHYPDGIDLNDFSAGVNVVPNPVKEEAFIELSLNTSQDVMFKLYNTQGQLVRSANEFIGSDFHRTRFDVSSVQSGIYILSIESANSTYTQKLIVE